MSSQISVPSDTTLSIKKKRMHFSGTNIPAAILMSEHFVKLKIDMPVYKLHFV